MLIQIFQREPALYFIIVGVVIASVVLHELGHAFAAIRQGDDTPRLLGHLTLNPVVHMGWFSLVLVALFGIGFGQTPVNPSRFRSKWGDAIVSGAGPAVNLLLFVVGATGLGLALRAHGGEFETRMPWGLVLLEQLAVLNVVLFLFNLLPIPPLDGSSVLANLSPGYAQFVRNPNNQPFFMGGIMLAFFLGGRVLFPFGEDVAWRYALWIANLGA